MSPANGATGTSGQGMPRRPAGGPRKPVVPVIPLPYLRPQRRNPSTSITVKSQSDSQPIRNEPASNISVPAQAQPSGPDPVTPPATTAHAVPATKDASATPPSAPSSKKEAGKRGHLPSCMRESSTLTFPPGADTPIAQVSTARPQPSVASPTPTRHRAGPPFHVLNGSQRQSHGQRGLGVSPEPVVNHDRLPSMDQARLHQAHPSNGSLIFGGLHDSNSSSPVPPTGGAQPPSSVSYTSEGTVPPGIDGFGRPFFVSPEFEGFPPDVFPPPVFRHRHNHHGPPTPHSFHGSQSSTHADENGYAAYGTANGHHGLPPHSAGHSQGHMATMSLDLQSGLHYPLSNGPAPPCAVSRLQAQTVEFLREGFERADFSDCTLELHLPNSHQPIVIPCHRFIISQSPMLNRVLRRRDIPAGGRLVLHVQDQYARSDSFGFALRTLYGWDLGDGPLPPYHPQQSAKEGFDVALGYVSCAAYLELPFVYAKGIHHACHQLNWETIEKACRFALPHTVFGQSARHGISPSSHGFAPLALLDAIKAFLVHNMPMDFILDVKAGDYGFSRLPRTSNFSASSHAGPVIAHGTSGSQQETQPGRQGSASRAHMPRTSRLSGNPRLSSIQFGDLSLANGQLGTPNGQTDAARPRSPSLVDTILSRILLNLPFPILKQVLEHPGLAQPSGDLSPTSRLKLISSVVAEREARRVATLSNGDPQLRVFMEALGSASEPLAVQQMGDFMVNSMGFKEEVFPGDVPYLVQTWINSSGSV
jgi:hypothetical protein